MEFLSQKTMFSDDPSTKGFDLSSGKKWIYPENYPVREYQFSIVKSALYHNTLVCLPTGLGKTLVAAVVMYNFWRWYPQGKIVFLAPTKPLVVQQIHACHDIMGISSEETIELTGATDQRKRQIAWTEHRVIFATPQVFHKDLEKNIVPSDLVKCVVVDEAHKALGKHSYCESIRLLSEQNQYFRVVGLSATPGGKLDAVQEVVRNLHITHLELRDDTSPDIIPYINERKLDIILVGLGAELEKFKDRYITIMDRHVRVLLENNVVRGNTGNISKGRIYMIQKEYGQKAHKGHNHGQIMKTLTILMTMYHAYELMIRHGLRAFYNFYQNHMDKFWLKDEPELLQLQEEIIYYLGPFPDVRPLPDGNSPAIPEDIRFGHNKFQMLKDLLVRHFESFEDKEENTRAIVFVEYRDIVNEVYVLLLQSRPLLRPQKFVGQAGQKQKQQKLALEDFRSNKVNVLISTSVGEEGLDVGEVDLIVCFDISQVSPIRLVQRMGRTGRKRDGHIIVLVTDGKEHQILKTAMSRRDSLNNKVLQSSGIIEALHESSPRMIPKEFNPECHKMHITVLPKSVATKVKGKIKDLKKPRKRAETTKKTKNSKISEPSTSNNKPASQSSLMKFLKRTRDEAELDFGNDIVGLTAKEPRPRTTQSSQQSLRINNTIKLSNVKLLSSDNAAIDFLTLCTMKRSENEQTNINKTKTNPYLPPHHAKNAQIDVFLDFEIPDLQILNCLKNITEYVAPLCENDKDELMISEVDDYCAVYTLSQRSQPAVQDSNFEALLDDSTSDSDSTMFDPQEVQNNDFPSTEKVDWAVNHNDMKFEDLLDEWSDDSIKYLGRNDSKEETTNDQLPSKFEDILNSSSDESDKTYYSPQKKAESPVEQRSNIEHPIEILSDSTSRDSLQTSWDKSRPPEPFEMLLDDETIDLLKDCKLKEISQLSADEPDRRPFKIISDIQEASTGGTAKNVPSKSLKPKEKFQLLANEFDNRPFKIVSQAQETSTSGTPKHSPLQSLKPKEKSQFLANEFDNRSFKSVSQAQEASTSGTSVNSTLNDRSPKEKSQILTNERDRRHSNIILDIHEAFTSGMQKNSTLKKVEPKEKFPLSANDFDRRHSKILLNPKDASSSDTKKNCTQVPSSMMTLSQTLEEIERINSSASTSNESRINNVKEGQTSSVFPDQAQGICNSRLSGTSIRETAKEQTSCKINEEIEENTESDEDIFGVNELMIDSDLEEQINKIERSVDTDVNTSGKQTSFDASANIADIEPDECQVISVKDTPNKVEQNSTALLAKPSVPELNFEDFDWDSEDINIADVKSPQPAASSACKKNLNNSNWDSKILNDRHLSAVKSPVVEIDIDDFDWDNDFSRDCSSLAAIPSCSKKNSEDDYWSRKVVKDPTPSSEKVSVSERSFADIDRNNKPDKNSPLPSAKSSVPEVILEDCDWSSDFEAFSTPLKSSTTVHKVADSRESPKGSASSLNNIEKNSRPGVKFSQLEDTTGWISTDKPKLHLTLGKKLSQNILHKNQQTKQTTKKQSPVKQDSDSENEFAVTRIETAVKEVKSDSFAKPADPVDKIKRFESLGMYNPRRVARGPLSLRRNDVNKVTVESLRDFSAPAKYTQQQQNQQQRDTKNSRSVGTGRQKSASLDLDTRRKKKLHRNERRRLRVRSEFVDDEAEVSSDGDHTSGSSGDDGDLDGFVSYTQHIDDSVDMQAHYMQTIRSPRRTAGFVIRKPKSPSPNLQIYSQALPNESNTYLYDSFCVAEDDDVFEDSETSDEISVLEEIEFDLQNKKRKRGYSTDVRAKMKRKLHVPASDMSSSEDETEKLRRQIQDESFVLRNKCE